MNIHHCAHTHEGALLHGLKMGTNFQISIAGIMRVNGNKLCWCMLIGESECYLDCSASYTISKS
jgi:hypothetical protein